MNVNEILQYVNFRLNKEQSGRSMTEDQYNLILSVINIEYMKWKYGLPEEYQPGSPIPRQFWEATQKITDDMRWAKVKMGGQEGAKMMVDQNGIAQIPSDYLHYSSIWYTYSLNSKDCGTKPATKVYPIEVLFDSQVGDRISHPVKGPTLKYPFCCFYNNYIEFWPKEISSVDFTYIRVPRTPVYAYTVVNDEAVYNANGSVQLEWPVDCHADIANLIVSLASENLRDQFMKQVSEQRKERGI